LPNPEPSGSYDTRPRHEWLRSHREIAGHDFLMHNFFTIETPMNKTLKAPDPLPPVLMDETTRIDSRGFGTYEVLVLMASRTPIAP
jgi:hypothetical protein